MLILAVAAPGKGSDVKKTSSVFWTPTHRQSAMSKVDRDAQARAVRDEIVARAHPWLKMSDDRLWDLMFGNTLRRAWTVWSDGHCPACGKSVPMYTWKVDALNEPWKVWCPHCQQRFPKNDFGKFYESGLDEHGIFDPAKADRSLLFNAEHPDPDDPLHSFGVDDGCGYAKGEKRWDFVGAYLVYGQWKQAVVGGINRLAAAYALTGDQVYAHKAAILLDRVADLYATFDYRSQGVLGDRDKPSNGYVSYWCSACEETREMALAYDQVFDALKNDATLVSFLARKAKRFKLENRKDSFADVQRNIEDRILRDALKNPHKISTNYPRNAIAVIIIRTVLDWPECRDEVMQQIDTMVRRASKVDGVTGEKGLGSYSDYGIRALAPFFGRFERAEPGFLAKLIERHPVLHQTYRFHIDTWCLQQYYPTVGDARYFAARGGRCKGISLPGWSQKTGHYRADLGPSGYTFLWRLYKATGDPVFAQIMYLSNKAGVKGLPYDLFEPDPAAVEAGVREVIEREGAELALGNVNKQQWHLAILRSGKGANARAAWVAYGIVGSHKHHDGMNLGLFGKGLDLMPDFGYPPVQYGGWGSKKVGWYYNTAAHNTVMIDHRCQTEAGGRTTLWADGTQVSIVRTSCPELIGGKQFERTVALVDVSDSEFYVIDVFRVIGGKDHAKFMHSHFGEMTTDGLNLEDTARYGTGTTMLPYLQMRKFKKDPAPKPGWSATWKIEDRYDYLPDDTQVWLRYTDLTAGAEAYTCQGWISEGTYNSSKEAWIPRVMTRRRSPDDVLESTFVAVIEPFEKKPAIVGIRRLPLLRPDGKPCPDAYVALEVRLRDGRRDLFVTTDVEDPMGRGPSLTEGDTLLQADCNLRLNGDTCLVRLSADGKPLWAAAYAARSLSVGGRKVRLPENKAFAEAPIDSSAPASGDR